MADPCLHVVARALPGRSLFTSWVDGGTLWRRLWAAAPDLVGMVLLPDRVDLLCLRYRPQRFAAALAGDGRGPGGVRAPHAPLPAPAEVAAGGLVRRTLRHLYQGPVERGVAASPLEWTFSTAREAVGLGVAAPADLALLDMRDDLGEEALRPDPAPPPPALVDAWAALHRRDPGDLRMDREAGRGFLRLLRPGDRQGSGVSLPGWRGGDLGAADADDRRASALLYRVVGDRRFRAPVGALDARR